MELKFCAKILQNENMDAAYVEVPYDIKEIFGKGRLLVNATFDGIPYRGQVVKMGTPCYIIGVTKQISARFFAVHYRKRKNAFHGVCRPTGKVITLFILLLRRNTSACIRALQQSKNLLKH